MAQTLMGRPVLEFDALMRGRIAFDYDDITLAPRLPSTLLHRSEATPDVAFGPVTLRAPMLGSPMPDVCGLAMCWALAGSGALGILHRFQPVGEEVRRLKEAAEAAAGPVGAAVGVTDDYQERFVRLAEAGCRIVCVDTANGAHIQVAEAVRWMRATAADVFLIAGNVASAEAFTWLEDQGVDAIRVGIAGGSVCETREETGVFVPTPYAVAEAASVRRRALIIGDSGVRSPSDMCKLLALGADCVMVGSAIAGTKEAPGRVIVVEGKKYKIMRGAASFSVQQEQDGEDPEYIEGAETLVPYKGRVVDVIRRYLAGLRSSMSYMDARTLREYRSNVRFLRLG
ncbi:MAG: guanosine monophosphate reductase [Candidatus Dormibacteraeota bacterium]|nr:guanosine monophosphate reductase [Candidatus Dormibacteraeota bacterium]MBV9525317.1 guanosine monophosphate reductase [Candidatus Dormibacteraeota bacterium]